MGDKANVAATIIIVAAFLLLFFWNSGGIGELIGRNTNVTDISPSPPLFSPTPTPTPTPTSTPTPTPPSEPSYSIHTMINFTRGVLYSLFVSEFTNNTPNYLKNLRLEIIDPSHIWQRLEISVNMTSNQFVLVNWLNAGSLYVECCHPPIFSENLWAAQAARVVWLNGIIYTSVPLGVYHLTVAMTANTCSPDGTITGSVSASMPLTITVTH